MTNGEICTAVNALFRTVCELKLNMDQNSLKSQMKFLTDLHTNRRALISSFVLYEYYSYDSFSLTKDEIDLMREFLLTYLGKFEDKDILDVFITTKNKSLRFAFVSFERASHTTGTMEVITEIENDISKLYDNSVFKIIDQIAATLPQDSIIVKIRNIQKLFKTGNLTSKYNENILGNYEELQKYVINASLSPIIPDDPNDCYPFEPYAPFEPNAPFEPSDPVPMVTFDFLDKKIGNLDEYHNIDENNIRAAISKILEITTTSELTQV